MTRAILRPWAPTVAVPVRTALPLIITRRRTGIAAPVLVVVVTPRHVLVIPALRRLSLTHSVGPWLDRQVIGRQLRWRRRGTNRIVEIGLLTVLPLAIVPVLAVVLELATVVATNDVIVLRARLIVAMALIISLMTALPLSTTLGPTVLRLIGQRLRSDTDTQQTNTGQTPDARLHAFPHCGDCWGTDSVGANSACT